MSNKERQPQEAESEGIEVSEPVGLSKIGDEDAAKQPGEEIAIELPIEEGDFDAQTR